jgi:phosphoenolpyruvate carboxykinase (GTP)
LRIDALDNADENLNNPDGVPIEGIFYGGRDSDTSVPVAESLSWEHGVFVGATIESETTSATLGAVGRRKSSPMANMDFIIVPLSLYLSNHLEIGRDLKHCPKVFATNYFLKGEDGRYLNEIMDKRAWVLWAEGRINGDYDAIPSPIGYLPTYEDLKMIFDQAFDDRSYSRQEYEQQFSIRVEKYLQKLDRMEKLYSSEENMPDAFWHVLASQREGLEALRDEFGQDVISPFALA